MCDPRVVEQPDLSPHIVERGVADLIAVEIAHRPTGWDRQRNDRAVAVGRSDAFDRGDPNAGAFGHRGVQRELRSADPWLDRHALLVDVAHAYRSQHSREELEVTVVLVEIDHLDGGAIRTSAIRTEMTTRVLIAQFVDLETGSGESGAQRCRARTSLR